MKWLPRHTLATGAALILAVNAFALAGVAYNRAGEPESTLVLSERELRRPPQDWGFERENSGLGLKLQWRVRSAAVDRDESYFLYTDRYGDPAWLTKEKLAELGVDVSQPVDTERGKRHYDKLPAREVLIVLEFDGESYREVLERARRQARDAVAPSKPSDPRMVSRAEAAAKRLEHEEKSATRLFAVDAGIDRQGLRAKYSDRTRYAIVHGRIQPRLTGEGRQARVGGYIEGLSIDQINVPLELRSVFESLAPDHGYNTPTQRFEARVSHGRRLEPWLVSAHKR